MFKKLPNSIRDLSLIRDVNSSIYQVNIELSIDKGLKNYKNVEQSIEEYIFGIYCEEILEIDTSVIYKLSKPISNQRRSVIITGFQIPYTFNYEDMFNHKDTLKNKHILNLLLNIPSKYISGKITKK